ncbi:MAG: COX15/CtaA family protein [Marinosulfonomonas sp.]|nr:COX15/CtaA family protein [Marinosulfonomonas sp.]
MSQKRSIFEDVASDEKAAVATPQPGLIDKAHRGARGAIRIWLAALFGIVVLMILVGGLTRLTDSGLSITEWKPVTGALPPMNAAAWDAEFTRYQAIPEYQLQNKGMSLAEFKAIYWWEWGHRQLGRIIGLVWAVGLLFFWATKRIPTGWTGRLIGVGVLGGLQGAIGWWMVSSGLGGGMLDVASYRLAIHLGLAFAILGLIAWYVLRLARSEADLMQARRGGETSLSGLSNVLLVLAFVQILLGALVAGIDAGRGYTDWPLMAGQFFPADAFDLAPWWRNFLEDDGLVQFMHRIGGYVVVIFGLFIWRRSRASGNMTTRRAFDWVAVLVFGQMVLGIGTVLYSAPLVLAIIHQLGAVLLWVAILRARFLSQYPPSQSIRGARP